MQCIQFCDVNSWVSCVKIDTKTGTKIKKANSQNMIKPLFSERYMSIVIKTDSN